jgi:hypothetical protein
MTISGGRVFFKKNELPEVHAVLVNGLSSLQKKHIPKNKSII